MKTVSNEDRQQRHLRERLAQTARHPEFERLLTDSKPRMCGMKASTIIRSKPAPSRVAAIGGRYFARGLASLNRVKQTLSPAASRRAWPHVTMAVEIIEA